MGPQHIVDDFRVRLTWDATGQAREHKPDDTHVRSVPANAAIPSDLHGGPPGAEGGLRRGFGKPGDCTYDQNGGDQASGVRHDNASDSN